jgi:hypothetical protein
MGQLTLPVEVYKRADGRWCKPCPSCGLEQDYLRRCYAIHSFTLGKECKTCSNRKTENSGRGLYNGVRLSWFHKCKVGAETRGILWSLVVEDVWQKYVDQEGVCNLSGIPIGWSAVGQSHTVSIDRIDSAKGYTVDNIQLLHKDINMMKQAFSQKHFVALCKSVSDKVKW